MNKLRFVWATIVSIALVLLPVTGVDAQSIVEFPVPIVNNPVLGSIPTGITGWAGR
jgi:hypothetical protein